MWEIRGVLIYLFAFYLSISRMNEVERSSGEDPSAHSDDLPSAGNLNPPKRPKRIPRKCTKCGKSVQNLSQHQKEVHSMTKLKRKLNEYLSGEKKAPKGKVKFCPLSPCKRQRTPIFQLHKHLQSSTHKLHPGSPSYVRALDKAPRVSLKDLGSYITERKKRTNQRLCESTRELDKPNKI